MEKLKSTFSSGTSKLTGAFNRERSLQSLRNTEAQTRSLNDRSLPMRSIVLYGVNMFFTFLAICTLGATAGFQGKWFGVTGGTGFSIVLLLLSLALAAALLALPLIYDRWDKGQRVSQFLAQPRSTFILHAFGGILMILGTLIITISAWTAKGCKNPDDDPHADLGDDFKNALGGWCRTKRACSIFCWFAFGTWVGLAAVSALEFRADRTYSRGREPAFIPPEEDPYATVAADDDDIFADKHEVGDSAMGGNGGGYSGAGRAQTPYGSNRTDAARLQNQSQSAMARPSVDVYGAFDGDMPGAPPQPSRTLQMAYNDPYDEVRASVIADTPPPAVHTPAPQAYPQAAPVYTSPPQAYAAPLPAQHQQPYAPPPQQYATPPPPQLPPQSYTPAPQTFSPPLQQQQYPPQQPGYGYH